MPTKTSNWPALTNRVFADVLAGFITREKPMLRPFHSPPVTQGGEQFRLGKISGELGPHGVTFHDSDIGQLPKPTESAWQTGRRNPAFAGPEVGRQVFKSTFQAVERELDSWKREQDGTVDAYALKE
jgi:hypothetical protein